MKEFTRFLVLGLLFCMSAEALTAQNHNNLVVYTNESRSFYLIVNGVKQNINPSTNVKVVGLPSKFCSLKVMFSDGRTPDIKQTITFTEMGREVCMGVFQKKGKFRMRFAGEFPLNESTSHGKQSVITYHDKEFTAEDLAKQQQQQSDIQINTSNTNITHKENTSLTATGEESTTINVQIKETGFNMDVQTNNNGNMNTTTTNNTTIENDKPTTQLTTTYSGFIANGTMCPSPTMSEKIYLDMKYVFDAENMFTREELILNTIKNNCMTSDQVAGIINLDYPTVKGVEVAKQAYRYTWDTENYGVVINALKTQQDKDDVMKFLNVSGTTGTVATTTTINSSQKDLGTQTQVYDTSIESTTQEFGSNTSYSSETAISLVSGYSGNVGCIDGLLIDEAKVKKMADDESFSDDKMNIIKQATRNKCMSTQQVITLSNTFSFESDKIEFAQWAYNKTYDVDEYYKVNQIFTHSSTKSDFNDFIESQPDKGYGTVTSSVGSDFSSPVPDYMGHIGCFEEVIDGKNVKEMVENEPFSDDKINVFNQALRNKCITVDQFISIAQTLSFEKDILEFAKIAYPKTFDQDDFYRVNSILTHSSSKKELDEIMK